MTLFKEKVGSRPPVYRADMTHPAEVLVYGPPGQKHKSGVLAQNTRMLVKTLDVASCPRDAGVIWGAQSDMTEQRGGSKFAGHPECKYRDHQLPYSPSRLRMNF